MEQLSTGELIFFNNRTGSFNNRGAIFLFERDPTPFVNNSGRLSLHTSSRGLNANVPGVSNILDQCDAVAVDADDNVYFSLYSSSSAPIQHVIYKVSGSDPTDVTVKLASDVRGLAVDGTTLYAGVASVPNEEATPPSGQEVIAALEDGYRSFWTGAYENTEGNAPAAHLEGWADAMTTTNTIAGFWKTTDEPRRVLENASDATDREIYLVPWENLHDAVGSATRVINYVESGGTVIVNGTDRTAMATAAAYFLRGISYGTLANLFDQSFRITELDTPDGQTLQPYDVILSEARADLADARMTADGETFVLDAFLPFTASVDADRLTRLANSFEARFIVSNARTRSETDAIDWSVVKTLTASGITRGLVMDLDGSDWLNRYQYFSGLHWYYRVDNRIINRMDTNYPVKYPADQAGSALAPAESPDARLCSATGDENSGSGSQAAVEEGCYFVYDTNQSLFNLQRGPTLQSNYFFLRNFVNEQWNEPPFAAGPGPIFLQEENRLMQAEAEVRLGNSEAARTLVNAGSRVTLGELPPLESTASDADILDAIMYERDVELYRTGLGLPFFDLRRRDALQIGTPLHMPVPASVLASLGEPVYTFGGVDAAGQAGPTGDVGTATGSNAWCNVDSDYGNTSPSGCDGPFTAPSGTSTKSLATATSPHADGPPVLPEGVRELLARRTRTFERNAKAITDPGLYRIGTDLSGDFQPVALNADVSLSGGMDVASDGQVYGYSGFNGSGTFKQVIVQVDPGASTPSFTTFQDPYANGVLSIVNRADVTDLEIATYEGAERVVILNSIPDRPSGAVSTEVVTFDLADRRFNFRYTNLDAVASEPMVVFDGTGEILIGKPNGRIVWSTVRPNAPVNLQISPGDEHAWLSWAIFPDVRLLGADVYRSTSAFTDTTQATRVNTDGYIAAELLPSRSGELAFIKDEGLTNGTTYYYQIVGVDERGNRGYVSSVLSVTPTPPIEVATATVPENTPTSFGSTGVTLELSAVRTEGAFTVEKYGTPPSTTLGIPESTVAPYRFVITQNVSSGVPDYIGIGRIDVSILDGVSDPNEVAIYPRDFPTARTFFQASGRDAGTVIDGGASIEFRVGDFDTEFAIASNTQPLPVELSSFVGTRQGENVELQWQTASETNNAGFVVERRAAGTSGFQRVGFVEGAGTTADARRYRFEDDVSNGRVGYAVDSLVYRLKQVDLDGTASYSSVVTVRRGTPDRVELLATFPNPARASATVRYAVPTRTEVRWQLFDVLGREVRAADLGAREGRHETRIRVDGLSPGLYFLRLSAGGTTRTQQITVVR